MYYVYEFFIVDTGEIIYVGKGTRNRYKCRCKRNVHLTSMLNLYECDSRIVKTFDSEEDAFSCENEYIKELKAKGQCVCNIYSGGAGGSGEYWTEELRKEYSVHNIMKSEHQRKRMSDNNPMKNHDVAVKVNSRKRKPVIIGNTEYCSVSQACKTLGVCGQTIKKWCKKGANPNGELCRYKNEKQIIFSGKRFNKGGCRSLMYNGKHYETPKDLAEEINVSVYKVYNWLRNGFDPYGFSIRYDDDDRTLAFELKKGASHPVIVNGVRYNSISDAGRNIGVSSQYLGDILKGKCKSNKYICRYDNQHPIHRNTDNSTVEGSTTNG